MSIGQHVQHYQAKKRAKAMQCARVKAVRNYESFAYFCNTQRRRIKQRFAKQAISRDAERRTSTGEWRERHERVRLSDYELIMRGNCRGAF